MSKILLVDDDEELTSMVTAWLAAEHYIVEVVHDGADALYRLEQLSYDAIILDLSLPHMDGLEVCKRFREKGGVTPILMLTGRATIDNKETGLDSGADDYLTKPFDMRELMARIRSVLRRPETYKSNTLHSGDIVLDTTTRVVTKGGKSISIMPVDLALLEFFMRHPNQVISTDAILDRVWHCDKSVTSNALRSSIKRLRRHLDDEGADSIIENIQKFGYCFKPRT